MTCVSQQAFDTEIFGLPFHRVVDLDEAGLERELPPLLRRKPIMIDAKVPASRSDLARLLIGLGFRLVLVWVGQQGSEAWRAAPPSRTHCVQEDMS